MKLKKILILGFAFVTSFLLFNKDVFAFGCEYYFDKPEYEVNDNDEAYVKKTEKKKITISLKNDKNGIKGECEAYDPNSRHSTLHCYLLDKNASSSLFVIEDQKLFCPSQIYVNSIHKAYISLAKNPEKVVKVFLTYKGDSGSNISSNFEVKGYAIAKLDKNSLDAGYYAYDNDKTNSDGSLNGCKTGGADQISNYKNFYIMKKNSLNVIEDTDGAGKELSDFLNNIDTSKDRNGKTTVYNVNNLNSYCYSFTDEGKAGIVEFQKIKEEILKEVENKIKTYTNISQSEKAEAFEKVKSIEVKYSDLEFSLKSNKNTYDCDSLLDDDLKNVIQLVLKWVRIGAPILLIILVAVDFSQVVISNDQDAIKKALSKSIKRVIAALALFFIPYLVSVMLDWIDPTLYFNPETAKCEEVLK